jgi:hypothetical protein
LADSANVIYVDTVKTLSEWTTTSTTTAPSLEDYENIGVSGVDASNLETVNSVIAEMSQIESDTSLEIQALFDTLATKIIKISNWNEEADAANKPTVDDYNLAGIINVDNSNHDVVNLVVSSKTPDESNTRAKIQALVVDADNLDTDALGKIARWTGDSSNSEEPTLADYTAINISGVTDDNLVLVNDVLAEASFDDSDTLAEIQNLATITAGAITKIANWDTNSNAENEPTEQDYLDANITSVNETSLETANSVMSELSFAQTDTRVEIQALVDGVVADIILIANYAAENDALTLANYTAAGITSVDDTNLIIVNSVMADTDFTQSNTRAKIQNLVDVKANAISIIAAYAGGSGIVPTVKNYDNADVLGVNEDDLHLINDEILKTGTAESADTTAEIQALANNVMGDSASSLAKIANWDGVADDTNSNVPSVQDYTNAGTTGVDSDNLDIVNNVIAETSSTDSDHTAEIQTLISVNAAGISKISNWADGTSGSTPIISDYENAGVIGVTSDNIGIINDTVRGVEADTRAKIQTLFDEMTDASASTLTASAGVVDLNNAKSSSITLQLKDDEGNNITTGGLKVSFTTSNEQATFSSVTDNNNGTYQTTISNFVTGTAWVYAIIENTKTKYFASVVWVDEQAPVMTTIADTHEIEENITGIIFTANATDYSSVQYSISGDDVSFFEINAANGNLTFKIPPNFEQPLDLNRDNIYYILVHATALGGTISQNQNFKIMDMDGDGEPNNSVFADGGTFRGLTYKYVTSPETGRIWLDRNLGANRVATKVEDSESYGYYYQWGRGNDDHEHVNSKAVIMSTLGEQPSITPNSPNHFDPDGKGKAGSEWDWTAEDVSGALRIAAWADDGVNAICPAGFEVPTQAEMQAETNGNHTADDVFDLFLKMPANGYRYADGEFANHSSGVDLATHLWLREIANNEDKGDTDYAVYFFAPAGNSSDKNMYDDRRAMGRGVRCILEVVN